MMKSYDSGDSKDVFSETEARCVSEGVVGAIGADKLEAAGVTVSDVAADEGNPFEAIGKELSASEAEDVVSVITDGDCFNFTDLVMKQAAGGASNPFKGVPEKKVRCLFDSLLSGKTFKSAMASSLLGRKGGDDALQDAFGDQSTILDIMGKCDLTPNELSGS